MQRRKPDIVLGNYWSESSHFADLYNAVLFEGRSIILPENLEEKDSRVSNILEHKELVRNITSERDVIKVVKYSRKYDAELAILGIENQDKIHYAMPLRIMEYDTFSYKKQYEENAEKNRKRKGLTEEEFLSGMRRTDKFVPVITIVIYYGEKAWDGAKCLRDMLVIPDEIGSYVNDYRMNLVELRKHNLVFHNSDNEDLFRICGILYDQSYTLGERKKQVIEYTEEKHVEDNVIIAVGAAVGKEITIEKKEGKSMCTFFDDLEKECEERGKERGKEIGKEMGKEMGREQGAAQQIVELGEEFGLSVSDILQKLQMKLHISTSKSREYIRIYGKTDYSSE